MLSVHNLSGSLTCSLLNLRLQHDRTDDCSHITSFNSVFHLLLFPHNSKVWIRLMRWPLSLLLLCMTWTTQVAPTASCAMQEVSWPSSTMTRLCLRATTLLWPFRSPPETISATSSRILNGTGLAVTFDSIHFFLGFLKVNGQLWCRINVGEFLQR